MKNTKIRIINGKSHSCFFIKQVVLIIHSCFYMFYVFLNIFLERVLKQEVLHEVTLASA